MHKTFNKLLLFVLLFIVALIQYSLNNLQKSKTNNKPKLFFQVALRLKKVVYLFWSGARIILQYLKSVLKIEKQNLLGMSMTL